MLNYVSIMKGSLLKYIFLIISFYIFSNSSFGQCSFTGLNANYCLTDDAAVLIGNTPVGTFSGTGVVGSNFDPSIAGVGSHTVTYTDNQYYTINQAGTFAPFVSATGWTTVSSGASDLEDLDDALSDAVNIGFSFNFFGNTYSQLFVSSNGNISFSSYTETLYLPTGITDNSNPNNFIALARTDLDPSDTGNDRIEYRVTGASPNRIFILDFKNVDRFNSNDEITTQLKLFETSNVIEIHTTQNQATSVTHSTLQGIENGTGDIGFIVSGRNNTFWTTSNDFVSFTPCSTSQLVVVEESPIVDAGVNSIECSIASYPLGGSIAGGVSDGIWSAVSVGADGTFDGGTTWSTATTYTPGTNDISNGFVTLRLESDDPGGVCSIIDEEITLTFDFPAAITTQPTASQTLCEGASLNLSVTATGTDLTYQWLKDGAPIATATNSTYTIASVAAADAATYTVEVTSAGVCIPATVTSNDAVVTVDEIPEIITQPTVSTICDGGNTTFTVDAGITSNPTYQWQVSTNGGASYSNLTNTGIYSTVTTNTLTITSATATEDGNLYRVVVSGSCAPSLTSDAVALTVDSPAAITTQPTASQTLCEGASLNLSVTATGTDLTYQWLKDGAPIATATNSTYTIASVAAADAATYTVEVTSAGVCIPATVTSNDAVVTVDEIPEIITQPTVSTICEGGNTTFTVDAGITSNPTYQWQVSTNGGASYSNLTNTGIYSTVTTNTLTITSATATEDGNLYRVMVSGSCAPSLTSDAVALTVDSPAAITTQPTASQTLCEGASLNLSVTATGTDLTYQWLKDGAPIATATNSTYTIASVAAADAATYTVEVTSAGVCIPATVTSNDAVVTVDEIPEIITQPTVSTICDGGNTTFTVDAGITSNPTYQWQVSTNGGASYSNLTNTGIYSTVTTNTLTITSATATEDGNLYRVVVSGSCAPSLTSDAVALTVDSPAAITTQPTASQTLCEGASLNLSVTATGTDLTYQWLKDGAPIATATNSTYTIASVAAADAATYTVEVTSAGVCIPATVTSNDAVVGVDVAPLITTQPLPVSQTLCVGDALNLSVVADGTGLSYQWLKDGVAIGGATSDTYSVGVVTTGTAGAYSVAVSSTGVCIPSTVNSNVATVIIDSPAAITTQPTASQTLCEGASLNLSVTATGTDLTYQWLKDGAPIATATNSTYTIASVAAADAATYTVEVTSAGVCIPATVTSNDAVVTVDEIPEIITQPTVSTICEGGNTTFTVDAGITSNPTYQWQVSTNGGASYSNLTNTGIYSTVTTNTLTITSATATEDGNLYRVVVSGSCAPSLTSDAVALTVDSPAAITTQPTASQTLCEGASLNLSVTATGTDLTYQWLKDGAPIATATNSTYTIASVAAADAATYTVEVTSAGVCIPATVTSNDAVVTVDEIPEIITQPTVSTICEGGNTTFTVDAGITSNPTYQWQVSTNGGASYSNLTNTGIYSTVTTNTLTITSATATEDGNLYRVVVSGSCAPSLTSDAVALTVDSPAAITTQPTASQTLCEGASLNLSVTATGTDLTYQWLKDGAPIATATNSTYTIASVAAADAATYTVEVTSAGVCIPATVTSNDAVVTVDEIPEIITQPTVSTICDGGNTTFTVDAGITSNPTYQWQVSTNGGASYSNLTNTGIYSTVTTNTLTITSATATEDGNLYRVVVSGSCAPSLTSDAVALTVDSPAAITTQPTASQTLCEGASLNLSVTATGTDLTYQWLKDGAPIATATNSTYTIASVAAADAATYTVEVTSAGVCIPATVTSNDAVVGVDVAPLITTQPLPVSQTLCVGDALNLSVVADGTGLSYQWLKDGVAIGGATSDTYSVGVVTTGTAGAYSVAVSSTGVCIPSTVNSNVATVIIDSPAAITTQPTASQTLCEGASLNLSVTATGTDLTYQWLKDGAPIATATNSTYTIASVAAADAATYTVEVTSAGVCIPATVTSNDAVVTVDEIPEIITQPTVSTICEGGNTTFTVDAGITSNPTYQWQVSTNGGASYSNLTNTGIYSTVTTNTLTITSATATEDGNLYRVVVSGSCAPSLTSDAVALTVDSPAAITTQPTASQTLCEGASLNLSVTATGTDLTYQWLKDGAPIATATNSTYTIASVAAADAATYTVEVTSAGVCIPATVTSNDAVVTVDEIPEIITQPTVSTICEGGNTTFTVDAGITSNPTYQWQVSTNGGASYSNLTNTGIYSTVTTNTLTITSATATEDGNLYRVVVSGSCAPSLTSDAVALTVDSPAAITTQPTASQTLCEGASLNLSVTATGTDLTYQWLKDGAPIATATNSTYTIASVAAADAATYTVEVTSAGVCIPATVTSNDAVVTVDEIPEIITQPTVSTICDGGNTTFTVDAGITSNPTYQWQVSTNGGASYSNLTNTGIYSTVTTNTLTITSSTATEDGNLYRVVVSGSCAPSLTSDAVALTVDSPAAITTQPTASQTLCEGASLNLSVTATGTDLTYQWLKDGAPIATATNSTYTIASVAAADAATYTVEVTSAGVCIPATVTSNDAVVTVDEIPEIITQPTVSTICDGGNTTFTVDAGITSNPTYQWQVSTNGGASYSNLTNTGIYSTVTTNTLTITSSTATEDGNLYRVVVSGSCAPSLTSDAVALTVDSPAAITTQPTASQTLCEGASLNLSVTATGTDLTYQWLKDGAPIATATNSTYTIASVAAADAATYTVEVTSAGACIPATVTSNDAVVGVDVAPLITTQPLPVSQTLCVGDALNLSVVADGTGLSYQWLKDGVAIGGATSDTYSVGVVTTGTAGAYSVAVSSTGVCIPSTVNSNVATVIIDSPAAITTQPTASQTLCEGASLNLSVTATGTDLTYQWLKDGAPIATATNSTYTIASVAAADAATYTVEVTSAGVCIPATVTSNDAVVTVDEIPEIITQPTVSTICDGGNTTFTVDAGITSNPTYQWQVSTNGGASYSNLTNTGIYSTVTTNTLTITSATATEDGNLYRVVVSGSCAPSLTSDAVALTVDSPAAITTQPTASQTLCEGASLNLSVTATGTDLTYQWLKDGAPIATATNSTYTIASVAAADAATYTVEVTSAGVCIPATVTSNDAVVGVDVAPLITTQPLPVSQTLCVGDALNLSVVADGTGLSYQWLKDGVAIGGATSDTYSVGVVTTGTAGAYSVAVSSTGVCIPSTVNSNVATVIIDSPAAITTQPTASQTLCEGASLNLSVTATGTDLTYQWLKDGAPIATATNSTYTIASVAAADAATYTVEVTSAGVCIPATVTSNDAVVTVDEIPEIITQPTVSTICEGGNTTFTVDAGITSNPTYQWQVSTNGGASYSNLTNTGIYSTVTTNTLTITSATATEDGNLYRVVVSGSCAPSLTSDAVALTVDSPAAITTQPTASQTLCEGASLNLSVTATGTDLTYQWLKDGAPIATATNSTYTIASVAAADAATYTVEVTSAGVCIPATVTSNDAVVTVDEIPEIITQPTVSTICEGGNTTFTVDAGITSNPTYQWQVSTNGGASYSNLTNTGIYSTVTTNTLTITSATATEDGNLYRVVVSGSCAPSLTSDAVALTVDSPAAITTQPTASQTLCEGASLNLSVTATGTDLTYQWLKDGAPIATATNSTYTIASVAAADAATYTVEVTSAGVCIPATVTSNDAVVTVDEIPEIITQPTVSTICDGGNTTFTVDAGITSNPTYQWQVSTNGGASYSNLTNTGIYSTVTTNTLTITSSTATEDGNLYRVVVSGSCAPSLTSDAVALTVDSPAAITTQPTASQTLCEGASLNLSVTATGTDLTYQWLKDGAPIATATNSTYTIASVAAADAATYTVEVTSAGVCIPATVTSNDAVVTVDEIPEIITQPTVSTICDGGNTTFTVDAGITSNPTYQWQVSTNGGASYSNLTNTGIYSTVTTNTLTITSSTATEDGNLYRVVVSGSCAPSLTSDAVALTVDSPAAITTQPTASQTLCEGASLNLSVTATGTDLTYQWLKDGAPIATATNSTYTIASVAAADAATYTVEVTSAGACIPATVTSNDAVVGVDVAPLITTQPLPVSQTLCVGDALNLSVVADGTGLSYQWLKDGVAIGGATSDTYSVGVVTTGTAGAYSVAVSSTGVCIPSTVNSNVATVIIDSPAAITTQPTASQTLCEGASLNLSVTATGTDLTYQWLKDGAPIATATNSTYTIASVAAADAATYTVEVTSAGVCIPATVTSNDAVVTVDEIPEIITQPTVSTICDGGNTTFTVDAGITSNPTYQWQVSTNGGASYSNLTNTGIYSTVTTNTLTITSSTATEDGNLYRVVVSGSCAPSLTSDAVALTVDSPAAITTQPTASQTLCEGASLNLSVTATGTDLTYQWLKDGAPIATATNSTYTIASVAAADAATYTVEVTSAGVCIPATVTSNDAVVGVDVAPLITTQPLPVSQTLCVGDALNLSVVADGTGLSYQWLKDGVAIGGATSDTYSVGVVTTGTAGAYSVAVSSTGVCIPSTVNSNVATVIIDSPAAITTQPTASQTLCEGASLNLSVTATGTDLTYQWLKDGAPIATATNSTYTIASVAAADAATYTVEVTSAGVCIPATVTSNDAVVDVNLIPNGTTVAAGIYEICSGTTLAITPISDVANSTFNWLGNNGSGGTGDITDTPINNSNSPINIVYTVTPTGPTPTFCEGTDFTITVTVNPNPSLTITNNATEICSGESVDIDLTSPTANAQINLLNVSYGAVTGGSAVGPYTTGDNISEALTNTTNDPITVTYEFEIVTTDGCPVAPSSQFASVIVNPQPTMGITNVAAAICSGESTDITLNSPTTSGVIRLDAVTGTAGVTGFTSSGVTFADGAVINDVLVNNTTAPITITYEFSVSVSGCADGVAAFTTTVTVNPNPSLTIANNATEICSGESVDIDLTSPTANAQINLLNVSYGAVTGGSAVGPYTTGDNISEALTNTTNDPITVTYEFEIVTTDGCPVAPSSQFASVIVNPQPTMGITNVAAAICSGESTDITLNSPTTSGVIRLDAVTGTTGVTGFTSSGVTFADGAVISDVLVNNTTAPVTITYEFSVSVSGCADGVAAFTTTVTVNPNPSLTITNNATEICSGESVDIDLTSPTANAQINLLNVSYGAVTGGSAVGPYTTGDNISEALTNTTNDPITVTYEFEIVTTDGCPVAPSSQFASVIVNPQPTMGITNVAAAICSGESTDITLNSPTTSGVIRLDAVTGTAGVTGFTSSGVTFADGAVINDVLVNNTTAPVTITYEFSVSVSGCADGVAAFTTTVTVNPNPSLTITNNTTEICSGESVDIDLTSPTANAQINLLNVSYGAVTGGSAVGPYTTGDNISEALTNTTNDPITVTYEFEIVTTDGCPVAPSSQFASVIVNPQPTMGITNVAAAICSGESTDITLNSPTTSGVIRLDAVTGTTGVTGFTSSGVTFADGAVISDVLVNNTTAPVTITYEFSVSVSGCADGVAAFTTTVTVNPNPSLTITNNATEICSGESVDIDLTSPTANAQINLLNVSYGAVTGGSAVGPYTTGDNISEALTNTTNDPITVTYEFEIVTTDGCPVAPSSQFASVIVNPQPTMGITNVAAAICSGESTDITLNSPTTSGVIRLDAVTGTAGVTGFTSSGVTFADGAVISDVLVNNTTAPVTITYEFSVSVSGCADGVAAFTTTVTVNPNPSLTITNNATEICSGESVDIDLTSPTANAQINLLNVSYGAVTGGSAVGPYTTGDNISEALTNTTNDPITVTYEFEIVTTDGCPVAPSSQFASVIVNPQPTMGITNVAAAICSGESTDITLNSPTTSGVIRLDAVTGTAGVTGFTSSGVTFADGAVISDVLVNNTTAPVTITYEFSVSVSGCADGVAAFTTTVTVNPNPSLTITNNATEICSGESVDIDLTSPTANAQINLLNVSYGAVTGGSAVGPYTTGDNISEALTNTTNDPITVTYEFEIVTTDGCPVAPSSQFASVIVNPQPTMGITNVAAAICSGESTDITLNSPTTSGVIRLDAVTGTAGVTGFTSSGVTFADGAVINDVLVNNTTAPITITYEFSVSVSGCADGVAAFTTTVTVNPNPSLTITNNATEICSGESVDIDLTSPTANAQINLLNVSYGAVTGGSAVGPYTTGDNISEALTNTTNDPITVTYEFEIVTTDGCPVAPSSQFASVIVNPQPTMGITNVAAAICSGESTDITLNSPTTSGVIRLDAVTGTAGVTGFTSSGVTFADGAVISDVLVNNTTAPVTITYEFSVSVSGCADGVAAFTTTVTVNPNPSLTIANNATEICSGESVDIDLTSPTANAQINLVGVNYGAASGSLSTGTYVDGDNINEVLTNITTTPVDVTYQFNITTSDGCPLVLTDQFVTVTVSPEPNFNIVNNASVICSGESADIDIISSTTGAVIEIVSVSASSPQIVGVQSVGSTYLNGAKIANQLSHPLNTQESVIYEFKVKVNNCENPATIFETIIINPIPNIATSVEAQTICDGESTNIVITNPNNVTNTSYSWTVVQSAGITGATNGTGGPTTASIIQTLSNTTNTPGTATYTITPSANGCSGLSKNIIVTVNPTPTLATSGDEVLCSGENTNIMLSNPNNVANTTFSWEVLNNVNNVSGASNGSGTVILQSLFVNSNSPAGSVTYRITPIANNCNGVFEDVVVTVNPLPVVFAGFDYEICADLGFINLSASLSGAATSGTWTGGNNPSGFSNNPVIDNEEITYQFNQADSLAGFVTFTLTSNDPDNGGPCSVATDQITVIINDLPVVSFNGLPAEAAENDPLIPLFGSPTGGIFSGSGISGNNFNPAGASVGVDNFVTYTYTDPVTGCTNSNTQSIFINGKPPIELGNDNVQVCFSDDAQLLLASPAGGVWTGTGVANIGGSVYEFRPATAGVGTHVLTYTFTDANNATNSADLTYEVYPVPEVDFEPLNLCFDSPIQFSDLSSINTSIIDSEIIGWNWQFFDEDDNIIGASNEQNPSIIFITPGDKRIVLEVISRSGTFSCSASLEKTITIGSVPDHMVPMGECM